MRLRFSTYNHSAIGRRSIEDVIDIIGQQLRALGHEVEWQDDNFIDQEHGLNIVFESFDETSLAELKRVYNLGCRFLMIATEEPTEKGFNYGATLHLTQRQKIFPRVAELCEGIFHLIPGEHITGWYGQYAPAAQAELGWSPGIMKPDRNPNPRWDFGFFGGVTRRREKMLKKLSRIGGIRLEGAFRTQEERDAAMQDAKIIVQIRGQEYLGLVSSSRCVTSLALGRPVLAEPHKLSKPWDEVVRFASTLEEFYATAALMRSMWRGIYQQQLAKFKARLSPEFCWGEPLRKVLAGASVPVASSDIYAQAPYDSVSG
jgi:hypothetical protein